MPKVLYIGFGISPYIKGGAVVYQEALVEAISASGWQTVCFFSTPRYNNFIPGKPHVKTWYRNNVKYIELLDPPYALGFQNDPERQCYDQVIEDLTRKILEDEKPDIVHFHEMQMHPASLIDIISDRIIPSLKTMHNYYDICPQRDLMFKSTEACSDFKDGELCTECISILPVKTSSFWKTFIKGVLPVGSYKYLTSFYKSTFKTAKSGHDQSTPQQSRKVAAFSSDKYLHRRQFFVDRLNRLDAVHCSTPRSAEIFAAHGVSREKIKLIPLSAHSIEKISPKPLRDTQHPVVFGFISGKNISRGYQVLIDAFSRLDQSKVKLIVWGTSRPETFDKNLNVEFRKPYKHEHINQILEEIDVGVVPSIWEEVFGIIGVEWLTARVPVIGSDIGGIPSWLNNDINGFLVPPNDPQQLANKMDLFVKDPGLIAQVQDRMKPWKLFSEHINEMLTFYESTMKQAKAL